MGLPLIFGAISAILLPLTLRIESPQYLMTKQKNEQALASIKKIYHASEDPDEILEYLKANTSQQTNSMTFKEALCDRRFNGALLVLFFSQLAITFNGGYALGFYAQVILGKIFGQTQEGVENVDLIQNIILVIEPLSFFLSIFTTRGKSRKLVFMLYAFTIALMNVGFGVCDLLHWAWPAAIFAIAIVVSQALLGIPIIIIYTIEIASNTMLAVQTVSQSIIFFAAGLLFPLLVDSSSQVAPLFFAFAACMFLYMLFVWKVIRETGTLSDKDKKELYSPYKSL